MGTPDGGWFDETPPHIVKTMPGKNATQVTSKKVSIYFDEFVKIADASQNVIVSPPQKEMPDIKAIAKKIQVTLKDTLKPNTTYTIDFSDAITDFTEDNPLGNYTYAFSTGDQIDTLQVAGYVIDASNLEPVKGILVGLYDDLADSAFHTKPMARVARTDANGHFSIKGVAAGKYRVYALQDMDDNYKFSQKSEVIAFSHDIYEPSVFLDMRQDTIWRDPLHIDSIAQVNYYHYLPDDIVLLSFQELQTGRYLLKAERKEPDRFTVFFSYGSEELPEIRGLNFNAEDAFLTEPSNKKDTLTYWLRDTILVNKDTLRLEMTYQTTDSLEQLVMKTDTIEVLAKTPYAKRMKAKHKAFEEWKKEQEKKKKREEPYDSIFPTPKLTPNYTVPQTMAPDQSIYIEMPSPLARLDTAAIHLYSKIDSLWYRAPFEFQKVKDKLRLYEIVVDWHPETEYSFEVDSAAFTDIYGLVSGEYKQGIKVKSLDDYSTLIIQVSGAKEEGTIMVELLDTSGKMLKRSKVEADGTAQFFYVNPGAYFTRAFIDRNNNGVWDTGNYDEDQQPEDMYYNPQQIEAKAKWDITKQWNLTAVPRNKQKPAALIKNKAENKKSVTSRNLERASQLGIEYIKK